MLARALALLIVLAGPAGAGEKLTGGSKNLPRNAVTSGGAAASGTGLALLDAVGEVAASSFTGTGLRLHTGLMPLAAQPGTVASITALSKSTGTLELSWTAPGLDGSVGSVSSGFYRIDASSDPLHAFSPTVYTAEFSTSVVAGAAQTYVLSGLLPNTTYYTRIYLADAAKTVAETSAPSDESTLANAPGSPVVSAVSSTTVQISWTVPAGGAEGFKADASLTSFGAVAAASSTAAGTAVTLTIAGLSPSTTYFFRVASFNWQSQPNHSLVLAAATLAPGSGLIPSITNLASQTDALNRKITLTWTNPSYPDPAGVVVIFSTNPITSGLADGTAYPAGTSLADGSTVRTHVASTTYVESGLELDTTAYFSLLSRNASNAYSVAVSTYLILDLPPMAPGGLQAEPEPGPTGIGPLASGNLRLKWSAVTSNLDGSPFKNKASPTPYELKGYAVYRSTTLVKAVWGTAIATAAADTLTYAVTPPASGQVEFYKVSAFDALSGNSELSMAASATGELFAVGADGVTQLKISPEIAASLSASGNSTGKPLLVQVLDRKSDLGGTTFKSVEFKVVSADDNKAVEGFKFSKPVDVVMHYDVSGGQVVPSASTLWFQTSELWSHGGPAGPLVGSGDASLRLGAFWFNGRDYVKLYGNVDPLTQTVTVQSSLPGVYQIRSFVRDAAFDFDLSGTFNKAITPNGDGLNDVAVWIYQNPRLSAVSGKIFDIRGAFVSDMSQGPVGTSLQWDGKSGGRAVSRGVYIYQIKAEQKNFTGTVMVIR